MHRGLELVRYKTYTNSKEVLLSTDESGEKIIILLERAFKTIFSWPEEEVFERWEEALKEAQKPPFSLSKEKKFAKKCVSPLKSLIFQSKVSVRTENLELKSAALSYCGISLAASDYKTLQIKMLYFSQQNKYVSVELMGRISFLETEWYVIYGELSVGIFNFFVSNDTDKWIPLSQEESINAIFQKENSDFLSADQAREFKVLCERIIRDNWLVAAGQFSLHSSEPNVLEINAEYKFSADTFVSTNAFVHMYAGIFQLPDNDVEKERLRSLSLDDQWSWTIRPIELTPLVMAQNRLWPGFCAVVDAFNKKIWNYYCGPALKESKHGSFPTSIPNLQKQPRGAPHNPMPEPHPLNLDEWIETDSDPETALEN